MLPPPGSSLDSGSYIDLLNRMTQRAQQQKADQKILELMSLMLEKELQAESIVLSQPEKLRLFRQVTKAVLAKMLEKLNGAK